MEPKKLKKTLFFVLLGGLLATSTLVLLFGGVGVPGGVIGCFAAGGSVDCTPLPPTNTSVPTPSTIKPKEVPLCEATAPFTFCRR